MIPRTKEIEVCRDVVKLAGFGWIYGIHGIGKTTFAREIIPMLESDGVNCKYLDLRAEKGIYPDLASCINEHAFGREPSENKHLNLKALRDLAFSQSERPVCVILDELDVYSPEEVEPVRRLAEVFMYASNRSLAIIFLSARSKSFYEQDDPSSKKHSEFFLRLEGFPKHETSNYIESLGYDKMASDRIVELSGGNPELIRILVSKHDPSNYNWSCLDNKGFDLELNHYFSSLWSGLNPDVRGIVTVVAIMFASLILQDENSRLKVTKDDLLTAAVRLNGLHPFGLWYRNIADIGDPASGVLPFAPPISPLFLPWVITNHASKLSMEDFRDEVTDAVAIFGGSVESWKSLSAAVSVVAGFEKLADKIITGFLS